MNANTEIKVGSTVKFSGITMKVVEINGDTLTCEFYTPAGGWGYTDVHTSEVQ